MLKVGFMEEHWRQIYKAGVLGAILRKSKWNLCLERLALGKGGGPRVRLRSFKRNNIASSPQISTLPTRGYTCLET